VTASRSSTLGDRYAEHNRGRGRGFVFGGAERSEALRAVIARAPTSGPVLDLGCRDGSLATALGLPRDRTVGADIDPEALVSARDADVLAPCTADLWGPFPFREGAFSLVVGGEILEHVPFPQDFIAEAARVLASGGRIAGSVPNAFKLKNRVMFASGRWFEADPTHLRQFSPGMLSGLLEQHFMQVEITPCVGRYARWWPRMLGNDLVWTGVKP